MREIRIIGSVALAAGLLALVPAGGAAQVDGAVLPFVGCWMEVGAPADAPMTCIVPERGGAALLTVNRAGVLERRTLRSDGATVAVEMRGCTGAESATPSSDRGRLYLRSELECEGGTSRSTRGLMAMTGPEEWIRVQALESAGAEGGAWTQRFRPAPPSRVEAAELPELTAALDELGLAIESARMASVAAITTDDVIEAHARTHPAVVRSWLAERGEPLDLDRESLVRMADAGVPAHVIDVAIAVTYPDRFTVGQHVERAARERESYDRYGHDRWAYRWGGYGWWPFYYDPFYYGTYPYGYGRYGAYGGWYGGWYGWGGSTVVIVQPGDGTEASPRGRVINGRGYTRTRSGVSPEAEGASRAARRGGEGRVKAGSGWSSSKTSSPASSRGSATSSTSSTTSKGKAKKKGGGG